MSHSFLHQRYEALWSEHADRIRSGDVALDSMLAAGKRTDQRRGLTLVVRPSPEIQERIVALLNNLQKLEPEQYYYAAADLHITFLGLYGATDKPEATFARTDDFIAAMQAGLRSVKPLQLAFSGVTVSPAAVLIQGFTDATALNAARDRLRHEIRERGLAANLEPRYRLETAHTSVVRFGHPLRNASAFASALEKARTLDFGEMIVTELQLVRNDWYMSKAHTELLGTFPLAAV